MGNIARDWHDTTMSSQGGSRPATRQRTPGSRTRTPEVTQQYIEKQKYRMRYNVANLTVKSFEHSVNRFSPEVAEEQLAAFLPSLMLTKSRPVSRVAISPDLPSRPHTVIRLEHEAPKHAPAAAAIVTSPHAHDGESAVTEALRNDPNLLEGDAAPPSRNTPSARNGGRRGGFEFPTLTRVDVLRRRRPPRPVQTRAAHSVLGRRGARTPALLDVGEAKMSERIMTSEPRPRSSLL